MQSRIGESFPSPKPSKNSADEIIREAELSLAARVEANSCFVEPDENALFPAIPGSRPVNRRPDTTARIFFECVVIERDAFAPDIFRALQGIRETVQRVIVGVENYCLVEKGRILGHADSRFPV